MTKYPIQEFLLHPKWRFTKVPGNKRIPSKRN